MTKQTKLTKAARGRDCQVRLPGCPNNTETTVLAHYRLAGTCGMGIKPNDLQGRTPTTTAIRSVTGAPRHRKA